MHVGFLSRHDSAMLIVYGRSSGKIDRSEIANMFTPLNHRPAVDAATAVCLHAEYYRRGAAEAGR